MYVLIALVTGVLVGFALGGRLRGIGEARLRWLPALVIAAVLQTAALRLTGTPGIACVLGSYVGLVAFTLANITFTGMGIVLIGVLMNFLVIAVNGGMPVRVSAIRAAGLAPNRNVQDLRLTAKRHLERPTDKLMPLADIVPLPLPGIGGQVLSFGDLVMSVGVADLIVQLMRTGRRTQRERLSSPVPEGSASTDSD